MPDRRLSAGKALRDEQIETPAHKRQPGKRIAECLWNREVNPS